ncbi:MAG: hypothetical protein RXR82_05295, partial [Nitrososphaeria archaeon]
WSGALSGTADPDSITVNAPASVTANFAPQISFPFLTAYDAINYYTGYNYWVAAVGQVSGYSGPLMLVFDITSAANGQTYTVSTTVDPNAQGWFYTGVLTIGGGYSVWGQGVSAKSLTIYAQYGGIWVPVTTSNGWPWGVETYLDTSGDGSWTVSVPNWDNIVLAQASSSTGSVNTLLPQETTVQLTATPASGWYLDQFSTSYTPWFGATSYQATYNANPATVTTPSVGTAAGSGGYTISATFEQTQVTFYVYSPMWTSISFTLYITEPNGSTITWSATTSLTINGWMASKTWTGLPLGNYFWDIVPSSYDGYQATPDAGAFTLETGGGTVQETITYGNQQLYYVEFSDGSSLPYNTTWWVDFNGINFSAPSQDDIIFYNVPTGTYPYSSGPNPYYPPGTSGVRYYASDSNGTVNVNTNKLVYIIYTTQYEATVTYTPANAYSTGTSPAPSSNGVATTWVDAGSSFTVTAYPATYWYVQDITGTPLPSGKTQYIQTGGVWVARNTWNNVQSPINAVVYFAPVQVNVQESGLPAGTTWSISYAGKLYSAQAGQTIIVKWDTNPNDNTFYPQVVPYGNGEYVPSPSSIQLPTSENPKSPPTDTVSYTYYYAITINAGPDGSVSWVTGAPAIPSSSGTVPAGSSETIYYSSAGSSAIQLTANPNSGYAFSSWSISGGLSYQFGYGPTSNPVELSVSGSGSVTANWNIATYSVTFNENGLPVGWTWNVTFNGQTQSATNWGAFGGYTITFNNVPPGTYYFTIPSQGSYVPSPSSGWVTVSSSDVTVYVTFSKSTYSYTWYEQGLPSGDTWYISVAGNTYSAAAGQSITVSGLSGSQSWSTWDADGYTPSPGSGTVSGPGSTTITWTAPSTYSYTWYESGLPSGTEWGITIGTQTWWSTTSSLTVSGLSGTNSWSVDAPSGYTASPSSGTISGAGSTTITFTQTSSTYNYTWYEYGLPSGDTWYIYVNGQVYSAPAGQPITVSGLSGSQYWFTWDADGYTAYPSSGTISGPGTTWIWWYY